MSPDRTVAARKDQALAGLDGGAAVQIFELVDIGAHVSVGRMGPGDRPQGIAGFNDVEMIGHASR